MLLSRVYMDLWTNQDDPVMYYALVRHFVNVDLPSMFQDKIKEKINYESEMKILDAELSELKKDMKNADPFTQDTVETYDIPDKYAEFAEKVWHATVDVLTEAGFNFPMGSRERRSV